MYEYRATVARVIDGDSIVVDIDLGFGVWLRGQHIRLHGINCPEVRGKERRQGLKVAGVVRAILTSWPQVRLQTHKDKKGKYGRWLGVVWVAKYRGDVNTMDTTVFNLNDWATFTRVRRTVVKPIRRNTIRVFQCGQLREAIAYAQTGAGALHLHQIVFPNSPNCFKQAVARGEDIAHLFMLDKEHLIRTAKRLGVRVVYVDREDTPRQHIDLCGRPLAKLLERVVQ